MVLRSLGLIVLLAMYTTVATADPKFAVFGDPQFITNCVGAVTAWPQGTDAYDWVAADGEFDAAVVLGDMVHSQGAGTDCECMGTVDPGVCTDIVHSLWGTEFCTTCGDAEAIACADSTPGLYCAWIRARALVDKLEVGGVPWVVTPGNHDADTFLHNPRATAVTYNVGWTIFNSYFGPGKTTGLGGDKGTFIGTRTVWGVGSKPGDKLGASSYLVVEADNQRFLLLSIHYFAEPDVLAWARGVVEKYPGMPTILLAHIIHSDTDVPTGWGDAAFHHRQGDTILAAFSQYPQIFMHLSGHDWNVISYEDTSQEYRILGQMMDYSYGVLGTPEVTGTTITHQYIDYGGGGAVGVMTIDMVAGQVSWYVYVPADDERDDFVVDANYRGVWSEKVQFCGTSGRFKMDPGACTGYKQNDLGGGIGR